MMPTGLMFAFARIGAMSVVCGFRWAASMSFGYYLINWLLQRDDANWV
jgi:hypothetical protein